MSAPLLPGELAELRARLVERTEAVASALLGEPVARTRTEIRFGSGHGSLAVVYTGARRGLWVDRAMVEAGGKFTGGDLLRLIQHVGGGGGFGSAVARACDLTGYVPPSRSAPEQRAAHAASLEADRQSREAEQADRRVKAEAARQAADTAAIATAAGMWACRAAAQGTPAEPYIATTRGTPIAAEQWPDCIAWHPGERALIAAATLPDGEVQAVQVVRLTGAGHKRLSVGLVKQSFGRLRTDAGRALVRLPARPGADPRVLVHAEGVETGLSAWWAFGAETWIALGSALSPEPGRVNVVCQDDDPAGSPRARSLATQVDAWRAAGLRIAVASPWDTPRGDRSDFNDLMRKAGPEAVRQRIYEALQTDKRAALAESGLESAPPPFALPTATPADVRAAMIGAVQGWFARRDQRTRVCLPGPTGSGKTHIAGELLPHIIAADKAERALGDSTRPYRWIVAVPSHRLGKQIADRYRRFGLDVAVLEGRGDPWTPAKPGRPHLCQNLEPVGLALRAHQDVRSAVCGTPKGKRRCPFFASCGYLQQFEHAKRADVLLVAHNFIFDRLPKAVMRDVAGVIIDEDFTQQGDAITDLSADTFSGAALNAAPVLQGGEPSAEDTAALRDIHSPFAAVLDSAPDGYLQPQALADAGLGKTQFNYAKHLNWKRKRDVGMHPAMTMEERREALTQSGVNAQLPRIDRMFHYLAAGEASRLRLYTEMSRSGARRMIKLHGQKKVAPWLDSMPVLMLSATARAQDVRRFFPDARVADVPQPALPHRQVHQILGGFGKRAMTPTKIAALVDDVRLRTLGMSRALVITYADTEAAFRAIPNVETRHHGDIAGDDDFGDVDAVFHIGGQFAGPSDIAALATARTGLPVPIARPRPTPCAALMDDGTGVRFDRMTYEHPAAQDVHDGIYLTSIMQGGLGRGRAINRSASTPLKEFIYANAPLPVPLASLSRWRLTRPGLVHRMVLAGRIDSNAHDTERFTELGTWEGIASARRRLPEPDLQDTARAILGAHPEAWSLVHWQPAGQGQKARWTLCPSGAVKRLKAAALSEFGRLVSWEPRPFTPGTRAAEKESVTTNLAPQHGLTDSSSAPPAWMLPSHDGRAARLSDPPDG